MTWSVSKACSRFTLGHNNTPDPARRYAVRLRGIKDTTQPSARQPTGEQSDCTHSLEFNNHNYIHNDFYHPSLTTPSRHGGSGQASAGVGRGFGTAPPNNIGSAPADHGAGKPAPTCCYISHFLVAGSYAPTPPLHPTPATEPA